MRILDEANIPSKEMMKRLSDLRVQAHHYEVSSNESLVITKVQWTFIFYNLLCCEVKYVICAKILYWCNFFKEL